MKYFSNVVSFVDEYLFWVVIAFLAACLIEFIVFFCKRKGGKFNWDSYFVAISTNLIVTLGLYVLACILVGGVNLLKAQDWHFWTNYMSFLTSVAAIIVFAIVLVVALIVFLIVFGGNIIAAVLCALLATAASVVLGFFVYVIGAVLFVILKLLWFVVSGFFQSIFQFIVKYWIECIIILIGPGVIYGACCAFINYIKSFKKEVGHK